jgi:diguanylate cyclase (GGDEF)-like protein/PAS domain S-box-containing protein
VAAGIAGVGNTWDWVHDVPSGVVVVVDGAVVAANDAAGAALAVGAAELLGDGLVRRAQPGQRPHVAQALAEVGVAGASVPQLVFTADSDPIRYVVLDFGPARDGAVVAAVSDATDYFHTMMLLAYSANTTMVVDDQAQILWGPVGRYAAQEMDSPWYGRGEANPFGWLHPEDIATVLESFNHVIATPGVMHELTVRTRHVVLEDQWGVATIRAINLTEDPLVQGILVQTHAQGTDQVVSLGRTTGSFQSIAEAAPIGIILSDHMGRPLYWNDVARELFDLGPPDRSDGATTEDADWPALAHPDHVEELRGLLDSAFRGGRGSLTARFDTPGGVTRWLAVTVAPQVNDMGEPMGWLATLQDMTREKATQHELEAARERLTHLAGHDPLTGLANRRLFAEQLQRARGRMARDDQGVALLFCDLDGFKPVNDSFGHETGDVVLTEVAERLRSTIRANDLVARLGGDEFVVLVEGFADRAELAALAERLLAETRRPIRAGRHEVTIGISMGVAIAGTSDTADSLLSRADDLMYQAKAAGRGRFVFDPSV